MQLSTKVLIGLGLGVLAGFFLGEFASIFEILGNVFILSLQMTVLPYIMVSLITGLGSLSYKDAITLAKKCLWILLVLWGIGIVLVLVMPLAFPAWEMASFFSTSLTEQKPEFNYLGFYIPSNIFYSLSGNIVPAVVVFSLALGIALIGVPDKEALIKGLRPVEKALGRITNFLVSLAPYGVFAIIASALGVMRFDELERLQVFMVTYMVISLLLTFWILPMLVNSLTPFRYKDLVGPLRTALITAFATGNIFVVLPILAESSKNLLRQKLENPSESDSAVDVIIPASFSFPNLGKVLSMSFVLFAGWFANVMIPVSKYPVFAATGFFSFFGDLSVAIPSLLGIFRIPSDTFRFFLIADNLIGTRFGTLLAAMYTLVLAVLGASAINGLLKIHWKKFILYLVVSLVLTAGCIGTIRVFYEYVIKYEYKEYETLVSMQMIRHYPEASVYSSKLPSPVQHNPGESKLDKIRERGFIRIGYFTDALPFAFTNIDGQLIGFDVELAYILAKDMNIKLELVHIDRTRATQMIDSGYVDIIMSGLAVTLERSAESGLSAPYINQTLAFIVNDHRLEEFNSRENVKRLKRLKIGTLNNPYYLQKLQSYLPQAELVILDSPRQFFTEKSDDLDAFLYSAEAGSAWSLVYPAYTVAIPYPDVLEVPLAFAFPKGDFEFKNFIDTWIELKKKDRTIQTLFDQWILGKSTMDKEPRWSVIRDVLHWVD